MKRLFCLRTALVLALLVWSGFFISTPPIAFAQTTSSVSDSPFNPDDDIELRDSDNTAPVDDFSSPTTSDEEALATPNSRDPFSLGFLDQYLFLGSENPIHIAAKLINVFLSFIGVIFVVLILWSGTQFLLSGGNEERVAAAKKTFFHAIVGLVIMLSAFSIVRFVLGGLGSATGAETTIGETTVETTDI